MPDGFQQSGGATAVGWFDQSTMGNALSGKLTGMYKRKDGLRTEGTSEYFQVQVDKACRVGAGARQDAKYIDANPSDFVERQLRSATSAWRTHPGHPERGDLRGVRHHRGSQDDDRQRQEMHNFNTGHSHPVPPREQDDGRGDALEDPTSAAAAYAAAMPRPVSIRVSYRKRRVHLLRLEAAVAKDTRQSQVWRAGTIRLAASWPCASSRPRLD